MKLAVASVSPIHMTVRCNDSRWRQEYETCADVVPVIVISVTTFIVTELTVSNIYYAVMFLRLKY